MEKAPVLNLSTGIPSLDNVLQGIRAGDNVVWQVDDIENYIPFVHAFCKHAYKERKKLIYFRFGHHKPLLPLDVDAKIVELEPVTGFEKFLSRTLSDIEENDRGACYVFDAVSDLAESWGSDAMLGNFFMLACPYLYNFDTATYFALLRNHHASSVIENIQKTAQVVIDVFNRDGDIYIHPLKVIDRASPTMFMLHAWRGEMF
nr:pyruvate, phosphate dikinase [Candidatus Sigynarchaeota archaeon]